MKSFEEYFSFEAIVADLIRWRVKGKGAFDENGRRDGGSTACARACSARCGAWWWKGSGTRDACPYRGGAAGVRALPCYAEACGAAGVRALPVAVGRRI